MKRRCASLLAATSMIAIAGSAVAQTVDAERAAAGAEPAQLDEVVVTGTLLRGVAPSGSEVVAVGRAGTSP